MKFHKEKIVLLHILGKKNVEIVRKMADQGVNASMVSRVVKRYKLTRERVQEKKNGKTKRVRNPKLIKVIRERIRRKPDQSGRSLARSLKVSSRTLYRVLHEDLGMKAYKKRKVAGLTTAQKIKRCKRARLLLDWHATDDIIFSDEKMFVLEVSHNSQNNRIYAKAAENIPLSIRQVPRFQNHTSIMVWGAICRRGKLPLIFIDKGVKINQKYYLEEVLEKNLLPEAQKLFGNDYYCFQQDGAPSHTAHLVQRWCNANLTDFITKDEWPPSSPDLNPLDFSSWGYLMQHMDVSKAHDVASFKALICKAWDEMPMKVVRAACDSFDRRLRKVITSKGERFEI